MGKVVCGACGGKCSGEVLRVTDKYFHTACFTCRTCSASLARGGFFCKDGHYYCPQDYQRAFGTRCAACNQYVEGEVVSALGNTYHQKCFTCARCKRAFPSGEKVTYTGSEVICGECAAPQRHAARATRSPDQASPSPASPSPASPGSPASPASPDRDDVDRRQPDPNDCAGCGQELSEGQALVALDRQWHTWCFACGECGAVLRGEYMGRGGVPYCERDYQRLYGVRCAYCQRYISGKVLQAGDNHHFHPTCARCSKCGDPFGDGEEMFLQGAAIWHPRCGPAPGDPLALDRACSELQFSMRSRTPSVNGSYCSPYSSLTRKYGYRGTSPGPNGTGRWGGWSPARITTYSYLASEPATLRRCVQPYDRPPTSPHFHRPPSSASIRTSSRPGSKASSRPGMRVLVDSMRSETPRPKSPHMNNEEPIELSHYPSAYKPPPGTQPKIERDDFPAPPYPYTDPERRRRRSETFKGVTDSDEEDGKPNGEVNGVDNKLRREELELAKIESGIAQVFLKEVKEREKLQQWKKQNLDPRNASRTPSAAREAAPRLRYSSPVGASPSRTLDREPHRPASASAATALASHQHIPSYNVVSSLRSAPRPGYGLAARSHTFSSSTAGDFTFSGMGDKTHSTDFSSGKSDISAGSITDVDRSAVSTEGGVIVRGGSAAAWRGAWGAWGRAAAACGARCPTWRRRTCCTSPPSSTRTTCCSSPTTACRPTSTASTSSGTCRTRSSRRSCKLRAASSTACRSGAATSSSAAPGSSSRAREHLDYREHREHREHQHHLPGEPRPRTDQRTTCHEPLRRAHLLTYVATWCAILFTRIQVITAPTVVHKYKTYRMIINNIVVNDYLIIWKMCNLSIYFCSSNTILVGR